VRTAGAIQSVVQSGCNSAVVIGYFRVPVYSAAEAAITLSLLNGTVASPCGGVYEAGQATLVVQIRQAICKHDSPLSAMMSVLHLMSKATCTCRTACSL
jgi:hypothetical protein